MSGEIPEWIQRFLDSETEMEHLRQTYRQWLELNNLGKKNLTIEEQKKLSEVTGDLAGLLNLRDRQGVGRGDFEYALQTIRFLEQIKAKGIKVGKVMQYQLGYYHYLEVQVTAIHFDRGRVSITRVDGQCFDPVGKRNATRVKVVGPSDLSNIR